MIWVACVGQKQQKNDTHKDDGTPKAVTSNTDPIVTRTTLLCQLLQNSHMSRFPERP